MCGVSLITWRRVGFGEVVLQRSGQVDTFEGTQIKKLLLRA